MQIHLLIKRTYYNNDLGERIDKVKDLNKYANIQPKSIQINMDSFEPLWIIRFLFKTFDESITSFDEIKCDDYQT
jgi:hypothetical protein